MLQRSFLAIFSVCLICGCSPQYEDVEIPFVAAFNGQPVGCLPDASQIALSDLRFYVSAPATFDQDGVSVPVSMFPDLAWQQQDIALLDLEDGSGNCVNGTPDLNTTLRLRVPSGDYRGLQFVVGVPFDRNHRDPLQATPPLGDAAMHWHWRSGYKFLRGGVTTGDDAFWIHVGSTACKGTVRNISGCDRPNRSTVRLPDFVLSEDTVVVDMGAFFSEIDLTDGEPGDCSSGPGETSCDGPFRELGIDFGTGSELGVQRVFRRQVSR